MEGVKFDLEFYFSWCQIKNYRSIPVGKLVLVCGLPWMERVFCLWRQWPVTLSIMAVTCWALFHSILSSKFCVMEMKRQVISISTFSYSWSVPFTFFYINWCLSFTDGHGCVVNMLHAACLTAKVNQRPLCVNILLQRKEVYAAFYFDLLKDKVKPTIRTKKCEWLSRVVLLYTEYLPTFCMGDRQYSWWIKVHGTTSLSLESRFAPVWFSHVWTTYTTEVKMS